MDSKEIVKKQSSNTLQTGVDFYHYSANGGESFIGFVSLNWPLSQQTLWGRTNPSPSRLSALGLQQFETNLKVKSTSGRDYGVFTHKVTATGIQFLNGLVTLPGETFHFHLDAVPNSLVLPPDIRPLSPNNILTAGQTDFDLGDFVNVNYPPRIERKGLKQYQCTTNNINNDGDFIIVDIGNGYGRIVRFKEAAPQEGVQVSADGLGIITRPDNSMMSYIEKAQGQIDALIAQVAEDSGVPESTFRTAPTFADLTYFGQLISKMLGLNISTPITKSLHWYTWTASRGSTRTVAVNFGSPGTGPLYDGDFTDYITPVFNSADGTSFIVKQDGYLSASISMNCPVGTYGYFTRNSVINTIDSGDQPYKIGALGYNANGILTTGMTDVKVSKGDFIHFYLSNSPVVGYNNLVMSFKSNTVKTIKDLIGA